MPEEKTEQPKGLMVRCKEFFGYKPGQDMRGFMAELRELSDKDKAELCAMFKAAGMPTDLTANK